MKEVVCNNALFGIVLCAAAWQAGVWVNEKLRTPLAHPLLVGIVLAVSFLAAFGIPLDWFRQGGQIISLLLAPATAALGLSVWRQRAVLQKNFWPVVLGCAAGSAVNALAVNGMCRLLALDAALTKSLLPRSVTTPIAVALSEQGGGLPSVTTLCVLFTGILGTVAAPFLVRLFRLEKEPVAAGVAIGTSSHVIGTTAAMGLGEVQGAMSSVSIGVAGLLTVALALVW
ncbi:LrgB family protein [Allofournierella sp.]|uniref:LrgB family protein n=1 Tax=Allofournierella sp. TaxID=1940256 RepID=UPI003AB6BD74